MLVEPCSGSTARAAALAESLQRSNRDPDCVRSNMRHSQTAQRPSWKSAAIQRVRTANESI